MSSLPRRSRARFLIRLFFVVVAAAAVLVGAAVLARPLLLPASRAAALVQRGVLARTGHDLTFRSARFTGLTTLRLDDVAVGQRASADAVSLRPAILPLFIGRLVLANVDLVHPRATLRLGPNGRWTPPAPPVGAPRRPLALSGLRIRAGTFSFVHASSPTADDVLIEHVDLTAHGVSFNGPVWVTGGALVHWRGAAAEAFVTGSADAAGDLRIEKLTLSSLGARADVDGTFRRVLSTAPAVDARATWTGLDPSSFTAVAALPDGLAVNGPTDGTLSVHLAAGDYRAQLATDMTRSAVEWKDMAQKAPGTPLRVATTIRRDGATLRLHDLSVRLASIDLSGDGEVRGSTEATRIATLRLKTAEFPIEDLFQHLRVEVPDGVLLRGPVSATVSVEGWTGGGEFVADVNGLRLDAGYKSLFRKAPGVPLRVLASGRYATPVAVDLSTLRLDVEGLRMSGSGSYTPGKEKPTYTFRMKSNAFPLTAAAALTPILAPYTPIGDGVLAFRVVRGEEGPAMSGDLTLVDAGAAIGGAKLTSLAGEAHFTDDAFSARGVTGRLDGAPLKLDFTAHRFTGRPFIEADVRVDEINLGTLLARSGPVASAVSASSAPFDTTGVLRAGHIEDPRFSAHDLTLEWDLAGVTRGLSGAEGKVTWRQGPGRLGDTSALADASALLRVAFLPTLTLQRLGRMAPEEAFEAIDSAVSIKGGAFSISPFVIQGGDRWNEVQGTGRVDGSALALHVTTKTPTGPREETISGSLAQPVSSARKR